MSVRAGTLVCPEPGCGVRVVNSTIADRGWVWEHQVHPSVTDKSGVWPGMMVGDYYRATVEHRERDDGVVEHAIRGTGF